MSDLRDSLVQSGTLIGYLNTIVYAHNYNDLSNKPQINGVTLTGNKTPSELGLVTPATEAVQSVNGETGNVVLDGNDIYYDSNNTVNEQIDAVAASINYPVTSVNEKTGAVVLDGMDIDYDSSYTINQKIDAVAADIPVVPVQSVNGETGDVMLDGDDIAYNSSISVNQKIDVVESSIPVVDYPVTSVAGKTGAVELYASDIMIQDTASGAVASFDTSLAIPFKACNCEIPYDANGYTGLKIGYCDFNQLCYEYNPNRSSLSSSTNTTSDITVTSTTSTSSSFGFIFRKNNASLSFTTGRKYFISVNITEISIDNFRRFAFESSMGAVTQYIETTGKFETIANPTANGAKSLNASTNNTAVTTSDTFKYNSVKVIDLTQAFGSTIADMIYTMESNNVGSGVALVNSILSKGFYDYTLGGSLVTVNSVNNDTNCPNASIDFNTTIYGGSLDVTNGKLTDKYNADGTEKTPVEIDVTPTAISAVSGYQNNIFSTAQGNNDITYLETIKDYIDKAVAT